MAKSEAVFPAKKDEELFGIGASFSAAIELR